MAVRDTLEEESVSSSSSSIFCPNYFGSLKELIPAGVKFVRSTSTLGRKRVGLSKYVHLASLSSPCGSSSSKKLCSRSTMERSDHLETLPQDVLVRILSKVDHGDLTRLLFVSKTVNHATSIAKEMHFALRTPISKPLFQDDIYSSEDAPNAPMQHRVARSRLCTINPSIALVLFP